MASTSCFSLSLILLFSITIASAATSSSSSNAVKKTYIIQVQHEAKPSIFTTHKHWYESSLASISASTETKSQNEETTRIIHTYETVFHGFSARLSPLEAQKLQSLSHIISVIPEQVRHIQTTRSPQFLGLKNANSAGLLKETDFGSDLVIGVLDTGIWPERQNFNDRDLVPAPIKWKGQCVARKGFRLALVPGKLLALGISLKCMNRSTGK